MIRLTTLRQATRRLTSNASNTRVRRDVTIHTDRIASRSYSASHWRIARVIERARCSLWIFFGSHWLAATWYPETAGGSAHLSPAQGWSPERCGRVKGVGATASQTREPAAR